MRVLRVTPPPALSLSTLFFTLLVQSYPMIFRSHDFSFQDFSFRHTRSFRLGQKNTVRTSLGDDDPSTEPFHHSLIAFSDFILGKEKHSESYMFPVLSSTSCPWSISRTKEAPHPHPSPPCQDPPTHTTHTHIHTQRLYSPIRPIELQCLIYILLFAYTAKRKKNPHGEKLLYSSIESPFNSNKLKMLHWQINFTSQEFLSHVIFIGSDNESSFLLWQWHLF